MQMNELAVERNLLKCHICKDHSVSNPRITLQQEIYLHPQVSLRAKTL